MGALFLRGLWRFECKHTIIFVVKSAIGNVGIIEVFLETLIKTKKEISSPDRN
jgi:hypothetical protein